ncbi:formate dehydrogenase subunit alpha [Sulfobacillus thermosulfidooxidans]|uniref:formate dehydrogenase subunit alpha n=2 Tax=Sulfobacillus thermosulfidooxidans TaxID=28034 RepID=UPI00096B779A|nr:formate dehydrogenase subunit alpha [Sulfobacillus thermosulfidooxidans]OLZ08121.1 formate dehydrogenase subunit alpha [Sulfobacillus thermosulfidooxidans]OLZ19622.1 formate dehydrogenase subunit alpha [Sulfobacillus thermosulfidooxidans]
MSQPGWEIIVDGQRLPGQKGQTILEVMLQNGMDLPHICYHPNLGPIQTCDTCIVETEGGLLRACATRIAPNMVVNTTSGNAKDARVEAMNRILHNHQLYCTVCDNNNGNCVVHNTTEMIGITHQKYPFEPKPYKPIDDTNPFYRYDVNQCILCGRCVEACQDLEVNETLSIDWSLERPRVVWDGGVDIGESSCVSCGHCVSVCPCNALMEKSMLGEAGYLTNIPADTLKPMIEFVEDIEPSLPPVFKLSDIESTMRQSRIKRTKTVCTYCGVGCSFDIWTKDRQILKVEPTYEAPTNGISTCVKGKFGWEFVNSPDRLTSPLIRRGDKFYEASWEEAYQLIAEKMTAIKQQYGPDAFMFIASSKASNEEAYLLQKLARNVIGTNNVDNDSTYCQDPATYGLRTTVGYGGDSGSIHDMEKADLIMTIGSNTAESHPVWATRVKRAHKLKGTKLVVVDIRKHEMAERADVWVKPKPGTDGIWILGLSKYLVDQGWIDRKFLTERVDGVDDYIESLAPYTLEYTAQMTGIPKETTVKVAEMIHEAHAMSILWAMGVTQQRDGSETSLAISNLLLLTGNFGRPGTGGYPLRGHNNVQGASDFGAKPHFLPGYQDPSDDEVRARFKKVWGTEIPKNMGVNNQELTGEILKGRIKMLYVVGEDTALVDADANQARNAFSQLEFMVVQEIFMTKTAQYADVILPASPSLEKEGTFVNTERRIQRFYQAMEPLKGTKPDWIILQEVAQHLGANWPVYRHPSEIMDEVAQLTPLLAGVRYDRLEGYHTLQWPVAPDGTDSPLLYIDRFHKPGGKAQLTPMSFVGPSQEAEKFDLHINNGQLLEHFHEGNMTYRVRGIEHLVPEVFVEVSKELAMERNLKDGMMVRLVSPTGSVKVPVLITDRVSGHELYLPMNSRGEGAINNITGTGIDTRTDTPAYKETVAYMEILDEEAPNKSPLPRYNWRFHKRHPQLGVQVEKKWRRRDYIPLVTTPAGKNQPLEEDDHGSAHH